MKEKYYLLDDSRICRGSFDEKLSLNSSLCYAAQEYSKGEWNRIPAYEINDCLLGFDVNEEPGRRMDNDWIRDSLRRISPEEAYRLIRSRTD